MSLATQALQAVELANARHPGNPWVQGAAIKVVQALEAQGWRDNIVGDGTSASACIDWTAGDASDWDRIVMYRYGSCDAWVARLAAALADLETALLNAGDSATAEVAASGEDSADNQRQLQRDLPGKPSDWWDTLPKPVQIGVVAVGAWLALDVWSKVR